MARVFLIDDDPDIIDSLTMILEASGHEVLSKMNTDDVVESIVEAAPDIVVLDVIFPEDPQAGFVSARLISADDRIKGIPVLILSAVNQQSNMSFGFSEADISSDFMPVQAFLEKPVEPKVLLSKIDQLLAAPQGSH